MGAELRVESLMQHARDATGLTDFGDDWSIAPLTKLVDCVNREAGLIAPDAGAGYRIQSGLADRLKLVDYFKQHPEAHDEQINVACAIVGLPRTGSTVMHRLLSATPQTIALLWWEAAFPLPFADEAPGEPQPRIAMANRFVDQLLENWPDFESIDPIEAEAVAEEVILLDRSFLSTSYD